MKELRIVIKNGRAQFVYDDALASLAALGTVTRASHVEFDNQLKGWTADMSPSGGGTIGPFPTRQEALEAERLWLQRERGL